MQGIRSVRIEGFRGIREGGIDGLVDVNVLVGRNNSGKSSVLEALCWCAPGQYDAASRDRIQRLCTARNEPSAPLGPQFHLGDTEKTIRVLIDHPWGERAFYDIKRTHRSFQGTPSRELVAFLSWMTIFFPSDLASREIESSLWSQILATRQDKALARELSTIFKMNLEGVQLLPDGRAMLLFEDHALPIDSQGDGARAVFRCLTVLSVMRGTLFMMEEPECHQHPGSLGRFAEAVCRYARSREVQLILTTHSLECARAFLRGAATAGSEAKVFNLELNDGLLTARGIPSDAADSLDAAGVDLRELDQYA